MTTIREYTLKKYFVSLTIANSLWSNKQRLIFKQNIFGTLGATLAKDYDNLYLFELKAYSKNAAFQYIQENIAVVLGEVGAIDTHYYFNISNTRGYNIHITE